MKYNFYLALIFILLRLIKTKTIELFDENNDIIVYKDVVSPYNYSFTINPGIKTCGNGDKIFLLVVVKSSPANHKRREMIRETWAKRSIFKEIRVLFSMGLDASPLINERTRMEFSFYNDIIQANFMDTYKNLTTKGLTTLKWISDYCLNAQFVLNCDDDIMVDMFLLLAHLKSLEKQKFNSNKTLMCNLVKDMPVSRDKKYKWYISESEYNKDYFDRYCSGAAYILTVDLVPKMFDYALHIKHVWIDDFFLTGLLGKLANVEYVDLKNGFLVYEMSEDKKLRMYSKPNTYYLFGHLPESEKKFYLAWRYITKKRLGLYSNYIVS